LYFGSGTLLAVSQSPFFGHSAQKVGIASAILPKAKGAKPNQEAKVLQFGV